MRMTHEARLTWLALAAAALPALVAIVLIWTSGLVLRTEVTLTLLCVLGPLSFSLILRERALRTLQTLGNLVGAVREGDYTLRARKHGGGALAEVQAEIDALSRHLRGLRLGGIEAAALLDRIVVAVEVAVLAFDDQWRLKLVNPAGEQLLGKPALRLLGRSSKELGLEFVFEGEAQRAVELPKRDGNWELARSPFRLEGRPHTLVMISDVSRPRREEERAAWQKLVRVLGHEIGNSLGPIQSVATLLREGLEKPSPSAAWIEDARSGLALISRRAEALARFTAAYARLARLPPPDIGPVEVEPWMQRVAALVGGTTVHGGPSVVALGDEDQLDQLLINLVRNGVEAASETGGGVTLSWSVGRRGVEIRIDDEGPGLPPSANLFVPFFTTKPEGNGIGLILARQIAEAHGGSLTLANRRDRTGCRATVVLPMAA